MVSKVAIFQKWLLFRDCSSKLDFNFGMLGIRLVVVDKWLLFRGDL
jgi:hypothetical protein